VLIFKKGVLFMDYVKVNDNELKVITTKEEINVYPYEWLIEQKATIQQQKTEKIAEYDNKLAEIDALISKCNELGIKAIEPVIEEMIK
jgi:16S rRNA U1498 N3-methylase RsmE